MTCYFFGVFLAFGAYGSRPDVLVTFSSTAPAHPHATRVAVYPALFSSSLENVLVISKLEKENDVLKWLFEYPFFLEVLYLAHCICQCQKTVNTIEKPSKTLLPHQAP